MLQSTPEKGRAERVEAATAAWEAANWASFPEWEHQIVTGPRPAIYTCFNESDLLVSRRLLRRLRLSDEREALRGGQHQRSERGRVPGRLPDRTGRGDPLPGRARDPRAAGVGAGSGEGRPRQGPTELKVHLLGPADPPSMARFNQAVGRPVRVDATPVTSASPAVRATSPASVRRRPRKPRRKPSWRPAGGRQRALRPGGRRPAHGLTRAPARGLRAHRRTRSREATASRDLRLRGPNTSGRSVPPITFAQG